MTTQDNHQSSSAPPYIALYARDFLADVGHLGNTELGLYWRLLLVYYRDARPLPFDTDRLRRLAMAMTPEEFRALDAVVAEFFILSAEPDGTRTWRHRRADDEIARARTRHASAVEKAARAAAGRWGKAKPPATAAPTDQEQSACKTDAGHASSIPQALLGLCQEEEEPEEDTSTVVEVGKQGSTARPSRSRAKKHAGAVTAHPSVGAADLIAAGVHPSHAADWIAVRKAKRAPLTATAWAGLQREASKAGITAADAVRLCAERGWISVRADWLAERGHGAQVEPFESFRDRAARERMERLAPAVARKAPARQQTIDLGAQETTDAIPRLVG